MDSIWFIAAFWMGLALVASRISIRVGIPVALTEILLGGPAHRISDHAHCSGSIVEPHANRPSPSQSAKHA